MVGGGAVLVSASLAGLVAVGVTLAVERWGGRIGGLLGTLPTTIVPAAWGIYVQDPSPEVFAQAMGVTPVGMLVNVAFLYLWRVLPPYLPADAGLGTRLLGMVVASLVGWSLAAALGMRLLARLHASGVSPLGVGAVLILVTVGCGVLACRHAPPAPAGRRRVGPLMLLARGLLAAAAIATAVWLAGVGGPLLAGMAAVFPAIFLTTMVSLWLSQGEAVQGGAVGPMMLGSSSVSTFALLAAGLFPQLGPAVGTLLAWLLAVALVTVPAWRWLQRRR